MEPISRIDATEGVLYFRGLSVADLTPHRDFEEVLYLLVHGDLPSSAEHGAMSQALTAKRQVFIDRLDSFRMTRERSGTPALELLVEAMDEIKEELSLTPYDACLTFVACVPIAVALDYRTNNGMEFVEPDAHMSHAANLLWMLTGKKPSSRDIHDFTTCLVLHMDDPDNPSLSALIDTLGKGGSLSVALTEAIREHRGRLHHGAGAEAAKMIIQCRDSPDIREYLRDRLLAGEKIYGLGHRIYRTLDPRARILRQMLRDRLAAEDPLPEVIERVASLGAEVLSEHKGIVVHPNVDLYNAVVYSTFGLPSSLNTDLFALSRAAGWMAHILDVLGAERV
ncbi:MAG: hypothetical protein DRO87_07380 [Candidatus Thorarchaeota archaeon]|nr:MAG: hypothetical protein DRP09_12370 [Candidatus Thorarchaeota archaeon]RLI57076.1 MAG: hypothetical protein DRO87_07380 [Candidatus Thorarchaeota archaeon]